MPKELIIVSDGTTENTHLYIDGAKQDVSRFSFYADVDEVQVHFNVEPTFFDGPSIEDLTDEVKKVHDAILSGKIPVLKKLKGMQDAKDTSTETV